MNKLSLFIDDSEIYLQKLLQDEYTLWGYTQENLNKTTEWKNGLAGMNTFFQEYFIHLDLSDKNDLKNFVELIDKRKKNNLFVDEWWGNGVIITTTHQQGSSKIVKLVKEFNGKVIEKQKSNVNKTNILSTLNLSKDLTSFVSEYAGYNYDILLILQNNLSKLTDKEIEELTIEKLYTFLSPKQGSIPPWEFVDSLLQGRIEESFEKLKRTHINTHYLVTLTFLKSKFNLLYSYTFLNSINVKSDDEKATILGLKSKFVFLSFKKMRNKLDLSTIEMICKLIYKAEEDLKGNIRINGNDYLENLTLEIYLLMKGA